MRSKWARMSPYPPLGPDGKEIARFSGYRSVKETAAFFGKLPR